MAVAQRSIQQWIACHQQHEATGICRKHGNMLYAGIYTCGCVIGDKESLRCAEDMAEREGFSRLSDVNVGDPSFRGASVTGVVVSRC